MAGDGREMARDDREEEQEEKKGKQGGIRTMPFIFANDICDRFAAAGFHANMISYLTLQMNMPLVKASNTLNYFGGTRSLTSIVGALIADSFAGRFWTITGGSIIYLLGMIILTMSAILPSFRPPPCEPKQTCQRASQWQLWILYISLLCSSIGSGGMGPCIVTFGADQLDVGDSNRTRQKWSFFNLYYFGTGLASLLALTVVVYIQDNVSWGWGLGIPTMVFAIASAIFVVGYPLYIKVKPGGSPLTRSVQVVVAAIKKRRAIKPDDPSLLYENKVLDADISVNGRLLHTNELVFFDRAAIVTEGDEPEPSRPKLWRLSTVHRVEELKSIIRMLPIWSTSILFVAAGSHNSTFALQQARSMDRHLSPSFQIPPASMSIFTTIAMLIGLVFYDRIFIPIARRFTGHPNGISYLQRLGIGLTITMLSNVVAAFIEVKRKAAAAEHGLLDRPHATIPISVFWIVPQHAIRGVAEAFASVGITEFLYEQSPESMRSTATALSWLSAAIGSYMGTILVNLVQEYTKGEWLQDNINRGKLDHYYWLVTSLEVINLVYYLVCTRIYTFKPLELSQPEDPMKAAVDGGDIELARVDSSAKYAPPQTGGHEAVDRDKNV